MSIQLLEDRLCLLHFPRDQLQRCSHSILKQILFRQYSSGMDSASTEPIFSYIDNALEVSIFGEYDRILRDFPPDLCPGLEISDQVYRALQVDNDDMFDSSKICTIVEPLAKAGVSIFYNSTYQTDLLFVQEEKLPVVYKAFQEHGIHISLLDHDLERLLDKTHQELAVDVRNDFPSLTPPHTPTTDKQHYPDHDDQLSSSSSIDNNEECDRENRQLEHNCMEQRCPRCHPASGENEHVEVEREKKDQTSDVGDECTQSLTPMTSLEQSLQQEMACRSVAESLRVERLSTAGALLSLPNEELNGIEEALHERHHRHQFQQQQHVCLQDQLSSETMVTPDPIFPSPAASLSSSGEHSRSFIATGQSSSYTQPSPSSYLHHYEKQAIPSQPSYSHKQASSLMLQTSQDVELKRGKGGSSSSASSSATASPTTATAFELRHQAIRTLPENLLRCVGLNTELEMGPPRWMLKIIKILFYEDHVQITRRKCHRMSHSHDSEEEDEASTTTVPRFFSFTATADSVSMITDVAILESEFEEHELFMSLDQCPLRLIRLDLHRFGLDKVGIVQSVARPLTEAGIELLYLSTFSTANILVLEHRLEDAEKILSGMTTPSVHTSS